MITPLDGRELVALKLAYAGCTNREIGEVLYRKEDQVKTLMRRVFRKLGAKNRTQAAIFVRERGWINQDGETK